MRHLEGLCIWGVGGGGEEVAGTRQRCETRGLKDSERR